MRSYYAHLETFAPPKNIAIAPKPTFRSSAIFPVMQQQGISSRILFMGYWILKRNIKEIAAVVTLRDTDGTVIARNNQAILDAKTYRIELADELELSGRGRNADFIGSMEVEFFSTQNLVFPFPAVVINYYGPRFSTVVHTAQRVYNDFEDMRRNSQTAVPESGFNIYADDTREPFIGLINGSAPQEKGVIDMQFINNIQEPLQCHVDLGPLAPYETKMLYPARLCDLKRHLKGHAGAGKILFNVNWIFPRLLVGNIHHNIPAVTLTHTYYDCSGAQSDSDYWRPAEPGWHPATLMVPAALANNHFTNIYFYPIYSPSTVGIDVEIYNPQGHLMGAKKNVLVLSAPRVEFHQIPVEKLCNELGINPKEDYALRLLAHPFPGSRLPARIKLGLDLGMNSMPDTPCNICTNLQPFNPSTDNKPTSFRWAPILADQPGACIWITNSSPAIDYRRTAELNLTFFHEKDAQTISRSITLPPHGFTILRIKEDKELNAFFDDTVGWMTAITTNPYTGTYYFDENPSGVVGGDHGF
jgi:hypothetical protein